MDQPSEIKVWDPFVRLFHWGLVGAVTVAGVTGFLLGARWIDIHIWAGTAALALVTSRILWGFIGTGPARFAGFVKGPAAALAHLDHSHRHLGHNPLGGLMVLALLAAVLALGVTGAVVLGGMFHVGPAKALFTVADGSGLHELHEILAIILLILIAGHLGGVAFESRRLRENLARAMVTGRKPARPGDLPLPKARAHPLMAALIGVGGMAAVVFVALPMTRAPVPDAPVAVAGTTYAEACAECHMAFHPSLLPAASWERLMATLDDHFGEDARLPQPETEELTAWLTAHAAETADTKPAARFGRAEPDVIAMTATPAWERVHEDLDEALFRGPPVFTKSNCAACHGDATSGWFYPGAIALPEPKELTSEEKDE